jgi:hypothetical protein
LEPIKIIKRSRAQESTAAIERLYITMRHLFYRGSYKPMGISGETLCDSLLTLRPEIYGSIAEDKVELNGLLYVIERLPRGIEECRYINLTSEEGFSKSHFKPIVPPKRRRNCYRIDDEQMNIEITRSRSDIYDVLTHLTFIFIESHKIRKRALLPETQETTRDWRKLEQIVSQKKKLLQSEREKAITHMAGLLGRTFEEVSVIYPVFATEQNPDALLNIIYWLGKIAITEVLESHYRVITFSPVLRERLGHHLHGEIWANTLKKILKENNWLHRPIHIISANMHSVMNTLFATKVLEDKKPQNSDNFYIYNELSKNNSQVIRNRVFDFAVEQGMIFIPDTSGALIDVQLFDTRKINFSETAFHNPNVEKGEEPILLVMDYAFGEQAYETIDELLKPLKEAEGDPKHLNVKSISIMGKAGILPGKKGDIMIPNAHFNEGTADNYPFKNELNATMFEDHNLNVYEGAMVTVLGTSLQNKDLLQFFHKSTWGAIGLEMEGAHYQKAIQAASQIRKSISPDVKIRYAYYASDNPLETGSTLASGGLGTTGVKPTYLITIKILEQILNTKHIN